MSILEEIKNMSREEKAELFNALRNAEESKPVEVIKLGSDMGIERRNDSGYLLTEEEYYDYTHRPLLWSEDYHTTTNGKVHRYSTEEIKSHNEEEMEEWRKRKREYAKEHGLEFSDEYHRNI